MFASAFQLVKEVAALWFQPVCLGCGSLSGTRVFCSRCPPFTPVDPPWCLQCGRGVPSPISVCGECTDWVAAPLDRLRTGFWLTEMAKVFLHEVKYRGRFELFSLLKEVGTFSFPFSDTPVLIPVPLHWSKYGARSFNQAEVLAVYLKKNFRLPICRQGLIKQRFSPSQTQLSKSSRAKNLKGAFVWTSNSAPPSSVCLIDDVYTTGATLGACAQALKNAGAKNVTAWTLFRTPWLP